jgi:hypothetical protein
MAAASPLLNRVWIATRDGGGGERGSFRVVCWNKLSTEARE